MELMNSQRLLACIIASLYLFFTPSFLSSKASASPFTQDDTINISINELMASNSSAIADADGDYSDWIELINYGDASVNLAGYGLSDKASQPFRWIFPAINLLPNQYLIIWASGKDRRDPAAPLHTNFSIKAEGEEVLLTHPSGTQIDYFPPRPMAADSSFGRYPNGIGPWFSYESSSPGFPNPQPQNQSLLSLPEFSHAGGFYSQAFELTLSHPDPEAGIIYTLDGSEPNLLNLGGKSYLYKNSYPALPGEAFGDFLTNTYQSLHYTGAIQIEDRSSAANYLSMISSTVAQQPDYLPALPVRKATVVKARAYKADGSISNSVCHSYFIFPGGRQSYPLPLISFCTNEDHLFDYYNGIYTAGVDYDEYRAQHPDEDYTQFDPSNWHRSGSEWEYPASFEYFATNQDNATLRQNIRFRLNGGASRSYSAKTLRLYAKGETDNYSFDHQFFPDEDFSSFKRLLLRNGGQAWNRDIIHDGVVQTICKGLKFHTQAYQPAVIFINSEYWGIHNIRERYDKYLIERVFAANPDCIDFLEDEAEVSEGDALHFQNMIKTATFNDLSIAENYQQMQNLMDMENFIDYIIAQVFTANRDWPDKNIRYWRAKTDSYHPDAPEYLDGRWRWMMHDVDLSFDNVALNSLQNLYDSPSYCGTLFRSLFAAPAFRESFARRYLDLMQIHFGKARMLDIINSKTREIESLIPEHSIRWKLPLSLSDWSYYINGMRDFAMNRPDFALNQLRDFCSLGEAFTLTLDVNQADAAIIVLNSLALDAQTDPYLRYPLDTKYLQGLPIQLKASPKAGYSFSHWEGDYSSDSAEITLYPCQDIYLKAVYLPQSQPPAQLIHYWHFNNLPSGALESIESDFSVGEKGSISYPGSGAGYMDSRSHRPQDPVSNLNLQMDVLPDQGAVLRVRNPADTRACIIQCPSTAFENLSLAFATCRTGNGAQNQVLYYSANAGESWELLRSYPVYELPDWELQSFDLSDISELNNNAELCFKILFTGDAAANSAGNNRFDNLSLFGTAIAPRLILNETRLDYGICRLGDSKKQSFTIQNDSDTGCTARLAAPEGFLIAPEDSPFIHAKEQLEYHFAPYSSATFDLYFAPQTRGTHQAELKIFQAGCAQALSLNLTGLGSQIYQIPFIDAFESDTMKGIVLNPAPASGWELNQESWDFGKQSLAAFALNTDSSQPCHLLYDLDFGETAGINKLSFDWESRIPPNTGASCQVRLVDWDFEPETGQSTQNGILLANLALTNSGKQHYEQSLDGISGQKRLLFTFAIPALQNTPKPLFVLDNLQILDPYTQIAKEVVDYRAIFRFAHLRPFDDPRLPNIKLQLDNIIAPNGSALFASLNMDKDYLLLPNVGLHFSLQGYRLDGSKLTLTNALGFKPRELVYGANQNPQWQLVSQDDSWTAQSLSFHVQNNESYRYGIELFCPIRKDAGFPYALNLFQISQAKNNALQIRWQSAFEQELSSYQLYRSNASFFHYAQPLASPLEAKNQMENQDYLYIDTEALSTPMSFYWLAVEDLNGKSYVHGPLRFSFNPDDPPDSPQPEKNRLLGAYPNPFNYYTSIAYELCEAAKIEIAIYNIKGQLIKKQSIKHDCPGRFFWDFDSLQQKQRRLPSGTYIIRLKSAKFSLTKKMLLLK